MKRRAFFIRQNKSDPLPDKAPNATIISSSSAKIGDIAVLGARLLPLFGTENPTENQEFVTSNSKDENIPSKIVV